MGKRDFLSTLAELRRLLLTAGQWSWFPFPGKRGNNLYKGLEPTLVIQAHNLMPTLGPSSPNHVLLLYRAMDPRRAPVDVCFVAPACGPALQPEITTPSDSAWL